MGKLNKYENFIANWFLSEFPKDMSFEDLKNRAKWEVQNSEEYDDTFLIWSPFETNEEIDDLMQDLLESLEHTFK